MSGNLYPDILELEVSEVIARSQSNVLPNVSQNMRNLEYIQEKETEQCHEQDTLKTIKSCVPGKHSVVNNKNNKSKYKSILLITNLFVMF